MHCPKCNTENPEAARFCLKCGAKLVLVCPQCNAELPAQAEFCIACGSRLATPPSKSLVESAADTVAQALARALPEGYAERLLATRGKVSGERRVVTMLFSDVRESTAMAEKLDPEDFAEVMNGAFEVLIEPISRYEGTLARLMGDAILAFFGAPIAHEDDPERACRAALEIIEGAQKYAARLEQERGIEGFNVRVGINTGLVVVGEVGSDLRVEYTAMGEAIILAQRMESAAQPGTVLITAETHKLIAPLFETEALGWIQVKGKTEPVSAYRVLAPSEGPAKARGIAGLESPLVGREAHLGALRDAIVRLRAGVGGIVTVVGEAGLGKSRLVAEIRREISMKRLYWIEGRCLSYGTSIAYLLWLDVLRELLGVTAKDQPVAVREHVHAMCPEAYENVYPYLARLTSLPLDSEEEATLRDLDGEKLKAATFAAIDTLIRSAASERPLVLVCEDLHWADPTSMELLEQLLALTDRAPLLFICIFRPQTEHASWRMKETAARLYRHRHTDLWLDPLSSDESETLVGNLLCPSPVPTGEAGRGPVAELPEALKHRILSHAEGNPFYVEELLRSLIDSEAIVRQEVTGTWQATRDVADIAIPDTLQGVLIARIDRLQEDTRRVLQLASVVGRIFLYRVLAAIAEEERELDAHLLGLQREQMIRERTRVPELEYTFKHHLTREAAYNGLLKKQRRIFHRQVAEALENLFSDRIEEQLGLLAYHWERAGDPEKATDYLLRAGDQARLVYAHQEAIDYYERALALLKERGEHERAARTFMKLALTHHNAFDFGRSARAYEEAFGLWQRPGAEERSPSPPPATHALRIPEGLPVESLDPANADPVVQALFSGLVQETPDRNLVPDVARNWEILEGGRKYIFHLRNDARWSDGSSVRAQDFEYAWKRVLDPATESPLAGLLYDVKGARAFHQREVPDPEGVGVWALDDVTLAVELEEPTGYFLHVLASSVARPVPRHMVEKHGESWTDLEHIVTNGPFRPETWQRDEVMVLSRNPRYHGRFRGNVQRVELSVVSDFFTVLDTFECDDVDILPLLYAMPAAQIHRARQRYAGEYVTTPADSTFYLAFDLSRPPFDDIRVRQALVLATDREGYAGLAWGGYPLPATGGFVPPGVPGHSPGIALPYDPQRARQLLAQASYQGGYGFPSIRSLTFLAAELGAEYLRAQWQQNLGLDIPWDKLKWTAFWNSVEDEPPHIFGMLWAADLPDPDNFLRVGFPWELTHWRNEAYEKLIEDARRLTDQPGRMRLYEEAQQILVQEAPMIPLAYVRYHTLVKPWVRNYPAPWKDIIIEPH